MCFNKSLLIDLLDGDALCRLRVGRHAVTSRALDARHQLYNTTAATVAADSADIDYYKSWRHNVTSYGDVNSSSLCHHDDANRRQYVEHIYESPKFDKRHVSWHAMPVRDCRTAGHVTRHCVTWLTASVSLSRVLCCHGFYDFMAGQCLLLRSFIIRVTPLIRQIIL